MVAMAFGACAKSDFVFSLTISPFNDTGRVRLRFLYPNELFNLTLTLPELYIQSRAVEGCECWRSIGRRTFMRHKQIRKVLPIFTLGLGAGRYNGLNFVMR